MTLLAAPTEAFEVHHERTFEAWCPLAPRLETTLRRLVGPDGPQAVQWSIRCHDLGKLTVPWQRAIAEKRRPPPHAAVGAAVLWQVADISDDARRAATFAVAIHHLDRGLVGENIDSPDVQAVMRGLVDDDGHIRWHEKAPELLPLLQLPENALERADLDALREMALELRAWSRGCATLEQHRRRLMASAVHHCLKVSDYRAAQQRGGEIDNALVRQLCEGGLLT